MTRVCDQAAGSGLAAQAVERNVMHTSWISSTSWKRLLASAGVSLPLVLAPVGHAQYDQQRHGQFYQGAYQGGRDGRYDEGRNYNRNGNYNRDGNYNRGDDRYHGHGIGTGSGAAIGGAGGAVLGAAFGGGLKGSLIGGAAGAGIGAVAGHAHQQSQKRNYYRNDGYRR